MAVSDLLKDVGQTLVSQSNISLSGVVGSITSGLIPDDFDIGSIVGQDVDSLASTFAQYTNLSEDYLKVIFTQSGFVDRVLGTLNPSSIVDNINNFFSNASEYMSYVTDYVDNLFSTFENGAVGFLNNVLAETGGGANEVIQAIADQPVPDNVKKQVVSSLYNNDVASAATALQPYSNQEPLVLQELLGYLDVTATGRIVIDASTSVFPEPFEIGSNLYDWSGSNTQGYQFSYISSYEELMAEARGITREVTEIVVHWTETFSNANLTAEQIHDIHVALGHNGIGYHYIIRRDGSLQRGRPVNLVGEHASTNNHDQRSVGIAFVGGLNISSSSVDPDEFGSAASLTAAQFKTFQAFLEVFYNQYPGIQVLGHNDIDVDQKDPGFDVIEYCYNKFNKISLFTDPTSQEPFTKNQLQNYNEQNIQTINYIKDPWTMY